ncbi:methyltransferase domain-containing protein [Myxococcaceae bacterium GXIMD 01537]
MKELHELLKYRHNTGTCSVCERNTVFIERAEWLRDHYCCVQCWSIPRQRALLEVLHGWFPQWRDMAIHESSPGGISSDKLKNECPRYVPTQFFPGVEAGTMHRGFRCENMERLTFADESFDLTVTQDVFEHILHPEQAFREVARTLKPGGAHVFTIPYYGPARTLRRAVERNGDIVHLLPPDFHGNPVDDKGSLVVTEWGTDLADIIQKASGLTTTHILLRDRSKGLDGKFLEVFVSRKAG